MKSLLAATILILVGSPVWALGPSGAFGGFGGNVQRRCSQVHFAAPVHASGARVAMRKTTGALDAAIRKTERAIHDHTVRIHSTIFEEVLPGNRPVRSTVLAMGRLHEFAQHTSVPEILFKSVDRHLRDDPFYGRLPFQVRETLLFHLTSFPNLKDYMGVEQAMIIAIRNHVRLNEAQARSVQSLVSLMKQKWILERYMQLMKGENDVATEVWGRDGERTFDDIRLDLSNFRSDVRRKYGHLTENTFNNLKRKLVGSDPKDLKIISGIGGILRMTRYQLTAEQMAVHPYSGILRLHLRVIAERMGLQHDFPLLSFFDLLRFANQSQNYETFLVKTFARGLEKKLATLEDRVELVDAVQEQRLSALAFSRSLQIKFGY